MYTGARRRADRAGVDDAAHRTVTRAAPQSIEQTRSVASGAGVSRRAAVRGDAGPATGGDALGAILARAVAERAHGSSQAGHAGATLQRFLGFGKKKKKPPRPTQALPAPPRPKGSLPKPDRPKQPLPPSAAASPSIFIPGAVPQALIDLGARQFGGVPQAPAPFEARQFDMDPFEARQFNLETEAPPVAPPAPAMQPKSPAADAPIDNKFAPELVPDETGLIPVEGNPYLEWLVSTYASDRGGTKGPRSYGALRNLQVIASLSGYPKPRPIDPRYLAATSTMRDWGFEY